MISASTPSAFRRRGQAGSLPDRPAESETPAGSSEHDQNFLNGKGVADADAGTKAEGNECAMQDVAVVRRHEPLGPECRRIVPQAQVPVDDPGRDEDLCAGLDPAAGDLVLCQGLSANKGRWRIEPKRLIYDRARE